MRDSRLSMSMSLQITVGGTARLFCYPNLPLQDADTSFGPAEQYLALPHSPLLLNVILIRRSSALNQVQQIRQHGSRVIQSLPFP